MHHVGNRNSPLRLPTLQMADHVPGRGICTEVLHLTLQFLDPVLSEIPQSCLEGGLHALDRMGFRDRDESDRTLNPSRRDLRSRDLLTHARERLGKSAGIRGEQR